MTTPEIARELITALDALPAKRLITGEYFSGDDCCAVGACIAQERELGQFAGYIIKENDNFDGTPEARWRHMRDWAQGIIDSTLTVTRD